MKIQDIVSIAGAQFQRNRMYCINCGIKHEKAVRYCRGCGLQTNYSKLDILKYNLKDYIHKNRAACIVAILILIVVIALVSLQGDSTLQQAPEPTETIPVERFSEATNDQVGSSVVNILCPNTENSNESSGGSGVIISKTGIIITNSHIIPQDAKYIKVSEEGCFVTIPDPVSGQINDIYLATPIVLPGVSDKYDLAFMSIYAAYYDKETKKQFGIYPRDFPVYENKTGCSDKDVQLGEPVRIYGYPTISGGYSLTITDGIVSSFPGEGLIITSAKISHGNSGGLAVDKNGCMIGVPSMVNSDDSESLGVIISTTLVNKFYDEATAFINNSEK